MEFRTHRKHHAKGLAIKALGINSVLIALAFASLEAVWPIYLHELFPSASQVGFITASLSIISLIGFMFLFPIFNTFTARKVLFTSVAVNAIVIALYAFTHNPIVFFVLAAINALFISLRIQSFGVLLRSNSSLKTISNNENQMYMLLNTGWVIGPLLAGFIGDKLSVDAVLILSSLFLLMSVYSITMYTTVLEKRKQQSLKKITPVQNILEFFRCKKRSISYILTTGLELWWSVPYIFIPIEMIKLGLPLHYVGIFLFLLCIPNIVIEEYMAKRKKRINPLIAITIGYLIVFICAIIASLCANIYITLGLLILASFGLGILEPSTETHFFSVVSKEQATRFYGSFFTAKMFGGFLGQFGVAFLLLCMNINKSLFVVGLFMLSFAIISAKFSKHKLRSSKK